MFESWPFTNFHDMNLDWIIRIIKTYTKKVDDLYNFGLYDFVEKVLAAHPEWTTTVMDGAIGKQKLTNELREEIEELPYYDNITLSTGRRNETDYYIVTVPEKDDEGEYIKIGLEYDSNNNPLEHAVKNGTNLTINGGCSYRINDQWVHGIMISNGEVMTEQVIPGGSLQGYTIAKDGVYVGITEDRRVLEYPVNSNISPEQMIRDGCQNVFNAYFKIVDNGQVVDLSTITWGEASDPDARNPLMVMGIKNDGTVLFIACDGRTCINKGMTYREMGDLLVANGCVRGYNLDGGGSTCMVYRGAKTNRNIDDYGTTVRNMAYTLNIRCSSGSNTSRGDFAQVGIEKQRLGSQIMKYINQIGIIPRTGEVIPENANLNNYTNPGKYTCQNQQTAATVVNTPVNDYGFELYVMAQGKGSGVYQMLLSNDGVTRFYRFVDENVADWTRLSQGATLVMGAEFNTHDMAASGQYEELTLSTDTIQMNTTLARAASVFEIVNNRLRFNKAGTVQITFSALLEANVAGKKFARITSTGPSGERHAHKNMYIAQYTTGVIPVTTTMNVVPGDVLSFEVYGEAGDDCYNSRFDLTFNTNYEGGQIF